MLQSKNVNNEAPIVLMQRTKYNAMAMLNIYTVGHIFMRFVLKSMIIPPNPMYVVVSHAHVNP